VVVDLLWMDDHADLAAGLHRVDLLDPRVPHCDLLELAEALRVVLERLAACTRPRAGERVDDVHDPALDSPELDLAVVGLHRLRHGLGLAVPARELAPDERVRALDLV